MPIVPKKVISRVAANLKRFQGIVSTARDRDVNECDTGTVLADILSELLGFDKYSEITREYAIRGQYCDLALKIDGKVHCLIEAKAVGIQLKEVHVQQAVSYAAQEGIEWIILSNGVTWRIYKIVFGQPIGQELIVELDFLALSAKQSKDIEMLYLISREGITKSALEEYDQLRQATDKFAIAAVVLSEPILKMIRRELRSLNDGVSVEIEDIKTTLQLEVIKRDIVEGQQADDARKRHTKASRRRDRESSAGVPKPDVALTVPLAAATLTEPKV